MPDIDIASTVPLKAYDTARLVATVRKIENLLAVEQELAAGPQRPSRYIACAVEVVGEELTEISAMAILGAIRVARMEGAATTGGD